MKVVLFCGGLGTRLRDYSDTIPKPMVTIGYRPILWHVMKYYAHFGHKDFILCLGYRADAIKNYFLDYNECASNDFVLSGGGKQVELSNSDIHAVHTQISHDTRGEYEHRLAGPTNLPPQPRGGAARGNLTVFAECPLHYAFPLPECGRLRELPQQVCSSREHQAQPPGCFNRSKQARANLFEWIGDQL